jgi:hypothetical protein
MFSCGGNFSLCSVESSYLLGKKLITFLFGGVLVVPNFMYVRYHLCSSN